MTDDLRARIALARARLILHKMNNHRWPKGTPNGGQFAPSNGSGSGGGAKVTAHHGHMASLFDSVFGGGGGKPSGGGNTFHETGWPGSGQWGKPKEPPKGAKTHPEVDDHGKPVVIEYPTKASTPDTWTNPKKTATFVPGGDAPASLNGVPMKPWAGPKNGWASVEGTNPALDEHDPFEPHPHKKTGAGVIIMEPDGRVWLTRPTNSFGGYMNTFPKGTAESGLTLQQNAIKEAFEETGLKIKIVGLLGDYERDTSKARMYVAVRVGGTPKRMGWESQALRLAPLGQARELLNKKHDKEILDHVAELHHFGKAASYQTQARWPKGSPLGGQWKAMGHDGITLPPVIAGGLGGKNPAYQKKVDAIHAAAQAGDKVALAKVIQQHEKYATAFADGVKSSSHVKWGAGVYQYAVQALTDTMAKPKAEAAADAISGPAKLSSFGQKVAEKPGGSNPGAVYEVNGEKWLVKGNKQFEQKNVTASQNDDRAKNEVLAAKLMQAAGVGAPEMRLVDLEGQFGGGLGVASKWETGAEGLNPNNANHVGLVQKDFATHAWLANYDVLGMGFDNTVIKDGKAVNIDPGGALLFRAQGLPKNLSALGGVLDPSAPEFESMRGNNGEQKAIFGKMTSEQLKASAAHLAKVDDATITKLVNTYGPGDAAFRAKLAANLIARRDAILAKAGVANEPGKVVPAPAVPPGAKLVPMPTGALAQAPIGLKGTMKAYTQKAIDHLKHGDLEGLKGLKSHLETQVSAFQGTAGSMFPGHTKVMAFLDAAIKEVEAKQSAGHAFPTKAGPDMSPEAAIKNVTSLIESGHLTQIKSPPPEPFGEYAPKGVDGQYSVAAITHFMSVGDKYAIATILGKAAFGKTSDSMAVAKYGMNALGHLIYKEQQAASTIASAMPKVQIPEKPKFQTGFETSDNYYTGVATKMEELHQHGDLNGLIAAGKGSYDDTGKKIKGVTEGTVWKPGSVNGTKLAAYHAALVADLSGKHSATIVAGAKAADAAVSAPPVKPARGPAMPNFEASKLPSHNSNAASHNAKVDQIAALAKAGDVKGLLSLNYGTNTYAKKQVSLANSALAALGSPHMVQVGQKTNSHPALFGGGTKATVNAAAVATKSIMPAPSPQVKKVDTSALDMSKMKDPPKPTFDKSSKAWVNEQNNKLAHEIEATYKSGNLDALSKMTFPVLNKETGAVIGTKPLSEHPAKDLLAYYDAALANMRDVAFPPEPLKHFDGKSAQSVHDIASAFPSKAMGSTITKAKANEKIGFWLALGKVSNPDRFVPKSVSNFTPTHISAAHSAYAKMSHLAKQFVSAMQASGSFADAYRNGKAEYNGINLKEAAKAALDAATTKPPGTTVYRWQQMTPDMIQKMLNSEKGTVIQATGPMPTSYDPYATAGFGPHRIKFVYADGAKAVDSFGSGGFKGEKEVTMLPNSRFVLLEAKMVKNDNPSYHGKERLEATVLLLPPDLGIHEGHHHAHAA